MASLTNNSTTTDVFLGKFVVSHECCFRDWVCYFMSWVCIFTCNFIIMQAWARNTSVILICCILYLRDMGIGARFLIKATWIRWKNMITNRDNIGGVGVLVVCWLIHWLILSMKPLTVVLSIHNLCSNWYLCKFTLQQPKHYIQLDIDLVTWTYFPQIVPHSKLFLA